MPKAHNAVVPTSTLADALVAELERRRLSQATLADILGDRQPTVNGWIKKMAVPNARRFPALREFLGLSWTDFGLAILAQCAARDGADLASLPAGPREVLATVETARRAAAGAPSAASAGRPSRASRPQRAGR